ncbi:unnamed protein product [Pseudo-nitzschia multistriata]|uniref:Heat shock factor binding protein 1 n=1 Tax=Pseudo-nitzschia multistriata TaxID=183589 RepID=A0A448ZPL6_9STRA|nr:unnamed protein product [Pseudo-nitzschia multistriata]
MEKASATNDLDERNSSGSVNEDKAKGVTDLVSDMLLEMENDFKKSGNSIRDRMREMGSKLDGLEQSINGLMHDAGLIDGEEESPSDSNPSPRRPPTNSSPPRTTMATSDSV